MNALVNLLRQERQASDLAAIVSCLSEEDRGLLRGIAAGYSRKALGQELQLGPDQVESRFDALFERIGARRTADAVRIAILAGL